MRKKCRYCAEVRTKKEQNTADMLAYMDSRKEQAQGIIDKYLEKLADPHKLENATISQIATAMGIVVDKFMDNTKKGENAQGVTILNDIPKPEKGNDDA